MHRPDRGFTTGARARGPESAPAGGGPAGGGGRQPVLLQRSAPPAPRVRPGTAWRGHGLRPVVPPRPGAGPRHRQGSAERVEEHVRPFGARAGS